MRSDGYFNARVALLLVACFAIQCVAAQVESSASKPGVAATLLKWTPLLAKGFFWNVVISAVAIAVGTALGFLLGVAQISPRRWLRSPSWLLTQFLRNSPWLVLLFFCMFLLPFRLQVFGVTIPVPDWMKAALGFALPVMAYVAEIVRGAIQSIPASQWESAESLAFSRTQILWSIIIPQCLKRMLPAWMNLVAIVAMASTLANMVGVSEVMTVAREILTAEQRQDLLLPMYGYLLMWFFAYCYPIARWTLSLERRWSVAT
jgi:polar amino acid transport system permease protein